MAEEKVVPKLEEYYVAYFDILGYKDLLEKAEDKQKFLNQVYNSIQSISMNIRNNNIVSSLSRNIDDDFMYNVFSDNICIYIKFADYDSRLLKLIEMLKDIQIDLFSSFGILIRGGITKGLFAANKGFIFGPALVKAVELEKQAKYPRILIDDCVVKDFDIIKKRFFDAWKKQSMLTEDDLSININTTFFLREIKKTLSSILLSIKTQQDFDNVKNIYNLVLQLENNNNLISNNTFKNDYLSLFRNITINHIDNMETIGIDFIYYHTYKTSINEIFINYFSFPTDPSIIKQNLSPFLPQLKILFKNDQEIVNDIVEFMYYDFTKDFIKNIQSHKQIVEKNLEKYKTNPKVFEKYMWAMLFHNDVCEKYGMKKYVISNDHLKSMI